MLTTARCVVVVLWLSLGLDLVSSLLVVMRMYAYNFPLSLTLCIDTCSITSWRMGRCSSKRVQWLKKTLKSRVLKFEKRKKRKVQE